MTLSIGGGPLSTAAGSKIFGEDLHSPEEISTLQDQALAQAVQHTSQIPDPAQRVGTQAGLLVSMIGRAVGYKSPEEQNALAIQNAFDRVDAAWKDDPSALPATNEANRLAMLQRETGHLLNPSQRMQLAGQIAALRSDAFNQNRLTQSDTREQGKYEADMRSAQVKLDNDKLTLDQARRVQQMGVAANQWVFKMPDGSTRTVGQGGNDFWQMMELANDPNNHIEVLGDLLEMQKYANQQKIAETRAAGGRKPLKIPLSLAGHYDDLNQLASYINYLQSPPGQAGMARAGGLKNVWDRMQESIAGIPVVGGVAGYLGIDGDTPSTQANVIYGKLRVAAQSLIKGVPSNNDQYILDLTNLKPSNAPAVNAARFAAITTDAKQRARAAYADWLNQVRSNGVDQPVPAALAAAIASLGIDVSDVGTVEEERKKLNELRKQNDPIVQELVRAGEKDTKNPVDVKSSAGDWQAQSMTTESGAEIE